MKLPNMTVEQAFSISQNRLDINDKQLLGQAYGILAAEQDYWYRHQHDKSLLENYNKANLDRHY